MSSALLRHDTRAGSIDTRYIDALGRAGISTWDQLVTAATKDQAIKLYSKGIGAVARKQIRAALEAAKVEHLMVRK